MTATTATTAAATAVLMLAGCGPDPLPVHAEVTWAEGREPSGPFEDDPRVQVVLEAVPQYFAARNALNYSDPALTEITMVSPLNSAANTEHTVIESRGGPDRLYEGPPSFTVVEIVEDSPQAGIDTIHVCGRRAPWWTLLGDDWVYPEEVVTERDGLFRIEQDHYTEARYQVREWDGKLMVRTFGGGGSVECDPGSEVAVPTFTTPPDLTLLTEATVDMVIGPDGQSRE